MPERLLTKVPTKEDLEPGWRIVVVDDKDGYGIEEEQKLEGEKDGDSKSDAEVESTIDYCTPSLRQTTPFLE